MQSHENDSIGNAIIISNLKFAAGKFSVPSDTAE